MNRTKRALAIVAVSTLMGCSTQIVPATTPTSNAIILRLDSTYSTATLATELTSEYQIYHPDISFEVRIGNYKANVERLRAGEINYFLSNHLSSQTDLWAAPIAQDGIMAVVNPQNRVESITIDQLRQIYQGTITNWSELGGNDQEITVLSREDGSGIRSDFNRMVMGARRTTANALVMSSPSNMQEEIANNPAAIGYLSIAEISPTIKPLTLDNIVPSIESIKDNTYPLRLTVFVIGLEEPEQDYRAFIGWMQGTVGQEIIAQTYAPLP